MSKLIFDIETIGENFEEMDAITQEVVTRWIKKESESEEEYKVALEELKSGLGFSPLTGEIVVIGFLDYEKNQGEICFQAPGEKPKDNEFEDAGVKFRLMTEKEMLERFWVVANSYAEFISFNGRGFDVPFIMIRSAIHGIRPTKDLMSNRYLSSQKYNAKHIDLLDQLSFYGAVRRKGNLHLWSRAFKIESPKTEEATGDKVGTLFREKKFKEIAKYNAKDLFATKELYQYWEKYVKM